jgi:hypothetical protein
VSGTLSFTNFVITSVRTAGGNTFITGTDVDVFAGGLSATFITVDKHIIFHADGSANFDGYGKGTGSVNGGPSGTFTAIFSATATPSGLDDGQIVIGNGTGGLSGIHGVIDFFTPSVGSPFDDYSGQVHFG